MATEIESIPESRGHVGIKSSSPFLPKYILKLFHRPFRIRKSQLRTGPESRPISIPNQIQLWTFTVSGPVSTLVSNSGPAYPVRGTWIFTFLTLWSILDIFVFSNWTWVEIDFIEIFDDCTSLFYWFMEPERPFQWIKNQFWDGQNNWNCLHEEHISNQISFFSWTSNPADDLFILEAWRLNTVTMCANVTLRNLPHCSKLK